MKHVHVSIGLLALDGLELSVGEARDLRRAVETELGRLLANSETPPGLAQGPSTARLSRRPLQLGAWRDPTDLGSQVARALFGGFGGRVE